MVPTRADRAALSSVRGALSAYPVGAARPAANSCPAPSTSRRTSSLLNPSQHWRGARRDRSAAVPL